VTRGAAVTRNDENLLARFPLGAACDPKFNSTFYPVERLWNFYGSDWVGMAGNLFGLWYISKQRKRGFLYGSLGCLGWLIFGILSGSIPSVLSNAIYIGMNVRGWRKWKDAPPKHAEK